MPPSGKHSYPATFSPPYLLKPVCTKSEIRPTLSPLPKGAYGRPSSCSGTVVGPQPSSLSTMLGTSKGAGIVSGPLYAIVFCSPRSAARLMQIDKQITFYDDSLAPNKQLHSYSNSQ